VRREGLRENGVVLLLLRVEPQVLEEEGLARPQAADGVLRPDTQRVARAGDVEAEEGREPLGDGAEPQAVLDLAVGPAEVAREDHPRALVQEVPDRGDGRPDPGVVLDLPVLERHVEVDADEDPLARRVELADGSLGHGALPVWTFVRARGPSRS
jgi:hypothetical protein